MAEFTLSQNLHDALDREFRPYIDRVVECLKKKEPVPPGLALTLRARLDTVLAEAGEEGNSLSDALHNMIYERGAPAILLHNLPVDAYNEEGLSLVLSEAFRQRINYDVHTVFHADLLSDEAAPQVRAGYTRDGFVAPHHDAQDYVLLQGLEAGGNPRHTPMFDAPSLAEYLAGTAREKGLTTMDRDRLVERFTALLQMPIWRVPEADENRAVSPETYHAYRATLASAGLLKVAKNDDGLHEGDGSHEYAPIFYPNINFRPDDPESMPYRFCRLPFVMLDKRAHCNKQEVPLDLQDTATLLSNVMLFHVNPVKAKTGPVLKAGDMLLFDNNLFMHAGGPYVHDILPAESVDEPPRQVIVRDIKRGALPPCAASQQVNQMQPAGKLQMAAPVIKSQPLP